jgi:Ca2+-binding EF-hand superfamily protein
MVHYGMDLVCQGVSIFKVMTTCFTAVTFHELFKEAALNGNSKLEFGLEWHKILDDIGAHMDGHEHNVNVDKLRQLFEETDEDGNGELDRDELMHVFQKYGCDVSRATAQNLIRLVDTKGSGTIHADEFFKVFEILEEVRSASHFGASKPA